jgi:hypothetical protein
MELGKRLGKVTVGQVQHLPPTNAVNVTENGNLADN